MQVLTGGDVRIDVRIDGAGGESLVLLAGFPLAREIWDAQSERLAAAYRIVRPDLRGMGSSGVVDGPYLMEALAADVAAVLDAIGIDRVTVVGHSAGGYVALAFARMYAERVDRLALVCSRLAADTPEQAQNRENLANLLETDESNDALADTYVMRLLSPASQRNPEIVQRVRAIAKRTDPHGAAAFLRGMALRSSAEDIASELAMPVLIGAGAQDAIVSLDEARGIAAAFPNARLAIAKHSGHVPMIEEPERTAAMLADWLGEEGPGRMTPASASGS